MSDIDEDQLRSFLPSGFGKQIESNDVDSRYEKAQRVEYTERLKNKDTENDSDSDADSDSDPDSDSDSDSLPISHQLIFRGHEKKISSISVDPQGNRFVTSSYDETIKFWDFNGMDSLALNSFRTVEPVEYHQVHKVLHSQSGNTVLTIPRYSKAKLYSRDGIELGEYKGGDMYLVDMKNTKGHVAEITSAEWNPINENDFLTGSHDSTIRIWDSTRFQSQKSVIVVRDSKGAAKNRITSVGWTKDGSSIIGGTLDGDLKLWDSRSSLIRPSHSISAAHTSTGSNNDISVGITSILSSSDNNTIVTRGGEGSELSGSVKIWDKRRFKTPVMQRLNLSNSSEETNIVFSPDERYLLTGTGSSLEILDRSDLTSISSIRLASDNTPAQITSVYWHSKLNQIFAGTSNAQLFLLFSKDHSSRGAKSILERAPKVRHIDDDPQATTNISVLGLNQEAIEYEQKQRKTKRKADSESFKPKSGESSLWGVPDKDHVESLGNTTTEDPRDALLKYADRAEKDDRFKNMPKEPKIFSSLDETDEDEQRQIENRRKKLRIGK